jgi:low affinity Fe/Cu permease
LPVRNIFFTALNCSRVARVISSLPVFLIALAAIVVRKISSFPSANMTSGKPFNFSLFRSYFAKPSSM